MERLLAERLAPAAPRALSLHLREGTSSLHRNVEKALGLPGSITNLLEYQACLSRFYRLYRPLEESLGRFTEWSSIGIVLSERVQSGKLAKDLHALDPRLIDLRDAPRQYLPEVASFANALGILYVLQGSTLGAQFILPAIAKTLGKPIEGSDSFFRAHGEATRACWTAFQASLDHYGQLHPNNARKVLDGAVAAFTSIGNWMHP